MCTLLTIWDAGGGAPQRGACDSGRVTTSASSPARPLELTLQITLQQARCLDALAREGTFQGAGVALRRGHTAILQAVRALEVETDLLLVDRRSYRTKLTEAGERILVECRKLLAAERELAAACHEIKSGWEPRLEIVFDGVYPAAPILAVVAELVRRDVPTRIVVRAEFLDGVEAAFRRDDAALMLAVLPPVDASLRALRLPALGASLVAHRAHPLAKGRAAHSREALARHVLLTVRGSDPRLVLSTSGLGARSTVHLNDFASKKAAILAGVGYGWLPDYLTERELRAGVLRRIRWEASSVHAFEPRLYHRSDHALGRAARRVVEVLAGKRALGAKAAAS